MDEFTVQKSKNPNKRLKFLENIPQNIFVSIHAFFQHFQAKNLDPPGLVNII